MWHLPAGHSFRLLPAVSRAPVSGVKLGKSYWNSTASLSVHVLLPWLVSWWLMLMILKLIVGHMYSRATLILTAMCFVSQTHYDALLVLLVTRAVTLAILRVSPEHCPASLCYELLKFRLSLMKIHKSGWVLFLWPCPVLALQIRTLGKKLVKLSQALAFLLRDFVTLHRYNEQCDSRFYFYFCCSDRELKLQHILLCHWRRCHTAEPIWADVRVCVCVCMRACVRACVCVRVLF